MAFAAVTDTGVSTIARLIVRLPDFWCDRLTSTDHSDCAQQRMKEKKMKILMVLTSHDQLCNTGRKSGFWLEEFAAPYFVFRDAGVQLTLASPKGRQPPIDPKSDLPENQTPAMARFKQDSEARRALAQAVRPVI